MENRLELNKRPTYELPGEVLIDTYSRNKNGDKIPSFNPDLCITSYGSIKIKEKKETFEQIWIKTDNVELLNYIKTTDFEKKIGRTTNAYRLHLWRFKKIILEEFYGVKYEE